MEIKEDTLAAIRNAVYGLHKRLAEVGVKLAKSFRPDELYKRDNPLEAIGSALRSCENTLGSLERAVDETASEHDRLKKEAEKVPELEKIAGDALTQLETVAKGR